MTSFKKTISATSTTSKRWWSLSFSRSDASKPESKVVRALLTVGVDIANGDKIPGFNTASAQEFQQIAQAHSLTPRSSLLEVPKLKAIVLGQLANMLHFYKDTPSQCGMSIKDFQKECLKKIQNDQITYPWLMLFGLRLSMFATPKKYHVLHERNNFTGNDAQALIKYWKNPDKLLMNLSDKLQKYAVDFPKSCMLPTTLGDLSVSTILDQVGSGVWLFGLINKPTVADDRDMQPIHFAWHDFVHFENLLYLMRDLENAPTTLAKIQDIRASLHTRYAKENHPEKREILEFILFIGLHENPGVFLELTSDSFTTIEKACLDMQKALERETSGFRDMRWFAEIYPTGNPTTLTDAQIHKHIQEWTNTVYKDFATQFHSQATAAS